MLFNPCFGCVVYYERLLFLCCTRLKDFDLVDLVKIIHTKFTKKNTGRGYRSFWGSTEGLVHHSYHYPTDSLISVSGVWALSPTRNAHFRIKLDESGLLLSIVLLDDLNERTDAWVGATSSSVDRVIATLRHIVGSGVNIFHRLVHVPHGSWIFSRVEPGGFNVVNDSGSWSCRIQPGEVSFEELPSGFNFINRDKG